MAKKYSCKCGKFESDNTKEWKAHLLAGNKKDGAGVHGGKIAGSTDAKSESSETMLSPGQIAASEEEEKKILAAVESRIENTTKGNISQEIKRPLKPTRQPFDKKRWLLLALGAGLGFLSGLLIMVWFSNPRNSLLGLAAVLSASGSIYLIISQLKRHESSAVITIQGIPSKPAKGPVNSLSVYGFRNKDKQPVAQAVVFEWIEKPLGQPWEIINTHEFVYCHLWNIDTNCLEPLFLPNEKYTSTSALAEYLAIEDEVKNALRARDSLIKYIGPGILALMCGVAFLVIVILAG